MPTIDKNSIIFDHRDWLAGLDPQAGVGKPKLFNGLDSAQEFNPFRFYTDCK